MARISPKERSKILNWWENTPFPTVINCAKTFQHDRGIIRAILDKNGISRPIDYTNTEHRQNNALRDEIKLLLKDIPYHIPRETATIKLPAKVLYFDDLHIPFVNLDAVEQMIEMDGDADGFVWGEVINLDAFGWYIKNYISNPLKEDEIAGKLVKALERRFKWGITLETNHTLRINKFLSRISDPIQLEFLRRTFGNLLPSFTSLSPKIQYNNSVLCSIGGAVCAHFDDFSAIAGRTAEWIESGLLNWGDCYKVPENWSSLWIGHTHQQSLHYKYGRMLAEVGAMNYAQDYVFRGKMKTSKYFRWVNGYGVIYLKKDGSTDLVKSHLQFLGFSQLPF